MAVGLRDMYMYIYIYSVPPPKPTVRQFLLIFTVCCAYFKGLEF